MTDVVRPVDPERLLAHADFVRAVARALLRDEHAAEDVVQETWAAALRSGPETGSLRGWLGGVTRNLARLRIRSDRRRAVRELAAARGEGVPSPADVLERERMRREVVEAVLALAEPYRGTLLLRYFEDLPPREVARRTGVPVETVRTRTRRGLDALRAALRGDRGRGTDARVVALAALAGDGGGVGRGGGGGGRATGGAIVAGFTKVAVTVAAAAGLALAAWILWPSGESPPAAPPAEVADGVADAPAGDRPGRATPPSDERAQAPEAAPVAPVVRGRVTDTGGAPVGGAAVLVGGTSNPFGADAREPVRFDEFVGRRILADADGRWEVTLAAAGTVVVALDRDPAYDAQGERRREVRAPADGVDFTVARKPCATLVVRVTDLDAGAPLKDFRCSFGGGAQGFSLLSAKDGVLEARLRLTQERGAAVKVTLADPAAPEPVAQEVIVDDGARAEVQLALRRSDVLRGRVLDAAGKPAEDVLVFLGSHLRGRGDEPFKPFRPDRIRDGVRTGADGAFELRGRGTVVTAWREDGSVATVPVAEAADLRLPAPGAIRGRLLDREGRPVGGAKLALDRARETETDADGRFSYDGVEPGVRGVMIPAEKRFVGVRVRPGAASEVAIEPGLEEVRIPWRGAAPKDALLVGLDDVAAVSIPTVDGSDLVARDVPKGRYLLLARGGVVVPIDVDGPAARAERGTCTLTVRAKPGSSAFVVPAGSGPLVDRLAARAATLTVDPNGEARFQLLRPGRYAVGFDRGSDDDELRTLVEVTPAGAEVQVDGSPPR